MNKLLEISFINFIEKKISLKSSKKKKKNKSIENNSNY